MKPKWLSLPIRGEVAPGPSPVDANSVQNKTKGRGGPAARNEMSYFRAKQRCIPDICYWQCPLAGSSVHPGRTSLLSYFFSFFLKPSAWLFFVRYVPCFNVMSFPAASGYASHILLWIEGSGLSLNMSSVAFTVLSDSHKSHLFSS